MTRRDDEGAVTALEVVVITPCLLVLLMFVVLAGRLGRTEQLVRAAAASGARAASVRSDSSMAASDAEAAVAAALATSGVSCRPHSSDLTVVDVRPGGRVSVTVHCTVVLDDLSLLALPGSKTISATAADVVDVYRGGT